MIFVQCSRWHMESQCARYSVAAYDFEKGAARGYTAWHRGPRKADRKDLYTGWSLDEAQKACRDHEKQKVAA
jgi:hypothetical protein